MEYKERASKTIAFVGILVLYTLFITFSQDFLLNCLNLAIPQQWAIKTSCAIGACAASFILISRIDNIFSFLGSNSFLKSVISSFARGIIFVGLYIVATILVIIIALFLALFDCEVPEKYRNSYERILHSLQSKVNAWSEEWKALLAILFLSCISLFLLFLLFTEYDSSQLVQILSYFVGGINIFSTLSVIISVKQMIKK